MSSRPAIQAAFLLFSPKSTDFSTKLYCSQIVHYFFKIRSTFSFPPVVSYICRQEVTISFFSLLSLNAASAARKAEPGSGQRHNFRTVSSGTFSQGRLPPGGPFRLPCTQRPASPLRAKNARFPEKGKRAFCYFFPARRICPTRRAKQSRDRPQVISSDRSSSKTRFPCIHSRSSVAERTASTTVCSK